MDGERRWIVRVGLNLVLVVGFGLGALAPSGPAIAQEEGTPAGRAGGRAEALWAMLERAPNVLAGVDPTEIASFADVAGQLDALGIEQPKDFDGEPFSLWFRATTHLTLPPAIARQALADDWRATFGFDVLQIDQALTVGEAPGTITLLRGRFSERELRRAWAGSGYRVAEEDGAVVASLFPGPELDTTTTVGALAWTTMNNAAILDDGTVAFAPTLEAVRGVVAVANGEAGSLADVPEVAALLEAAPEVAGAILVDGDALRRGELLEAAFGSGAPPAGVINLVEEVLANTERLGAVRLALVGVTPGGPLPELEGEGEAAASGGPNVPDARFEVALLMTDEAAAEAGVPAVEERLDSMQSLTTRRFYDDYFPGAGRRVAAVPGTAVLLADLGLGRDTSLAIWRDMVYRRDLAFVAW